MSGSWLVNHRPDGMGWNVVVGDGLHIGPFERDKAEAIVRDHESELTALRAEVARLTAERDVFRKRWAGQGKARLSWILQRMHEAEETWAPFVGYYGGESRRSVESAFFEAWPLVVAALAEANKQAEAMAKALTVLHDRMDEYNNGHNIGLEMMYCFWCADWPPPADLTGYDANGIKHKDSCPLIIARAVLASLPATSKGEE